MPTNIGFPPGPRGFPVLGILPMLRRDPPATFLWAREHFGDFVTLPIANRRMLLLSDPEGVKRVLVDNSRAYRKGRGIQKMREVLGDGLPTSEGDLWLRQRRLAQPAFHREKLARMADGMAEVTRRQLLTVLDGAASSGQPVDLVALMTEVTLSIVSRALFGTEIEAQDLRLVEQSMPPVLDRAIARSRALSDRPPLPTPSGRRARLAAQALDRVVLGVIADRKESVQPRGDLLDMLLGASDEAGGSMSDTQLRDEVMTLFPAGHETTASLLTSLFWYVSGNPGVAACLDAELESVDSFGAESVRTLPYLMACIHETLRLSPPAWAVPREALQEDEVLGYRVLKGASVMISPYVLHRHPDYWERPEQFIPERFLEQADRPTHTYLPFGAGPRQCIGNNFALMEAAIVAGLALKEYRLTPLGPLTMQPSVTLRPQGPAWANIGRR